MDTSREPGLIVYAGTVNVEKRADLRRIRAPGLALVWTHYDPPAAAIVGRAASYAEAHEVERHLRELPGVTRVELTFPRGGALATDRLLAWVRAERERWKKRGQET